MPRSNYNIFSLSIGAGFNTTELDPFERACGIRVRFLPDDFFLEAFFADFFAFFFGEFFFFFEPDNRSFLIFSFSLRTRLSKLSIFFFTFDISTTLSKLFYIAGP